MKNTIPVIVEEGTSHFFWVKSIFSGLRQSAGKSNFLLEIMDSAEPVNRSKYNENGSIIVVGYTVDWLRETINILIGKGLKPIVVNSCLSDSLCKTCNAVFLQLEDSVSGAMRYLISAGRRNIALLGTNSHSLADRLKEETFKRFFGAESEELIFKGSNPLSECIDEFIDFFVNSNIDAVICSNDTVAIYLINRMLNDGFNIPENLYVIGMGNSKLGQNISIPLTTIDFDYEELGRQAIVMWKYIQKSEGIEHIEISIPCRFITRASTEDIAAADNLFDSFKSDALNERNIAIDANEFYEDTDVQKVIRFDDFLLSCDDLDYFLLQEILQGISDTKMAERLNISDRAIRYRVNKMIKKLNVQNREEIVNLIRDLRAFGCKP